MPKREIQIRGKPVIFSSKTLKNGKTRYYRDGKLTSPGYQTRVARGILSGKTLAESRGHPFGSYSGKLLTRREIEEQEEFHLGGWAEPPRASGRGSEKAAYYMKVSVTTKSLRKSGSPTGSEEACELRTLQLVNPDSNTQDGFTYLQVARNFERIALATLKRYSLELCKGNLHTDIHQVWRHSRR